MVRIGRPGRDFRLPGPGPAPDVAKEPMIVTTVPKSAARLLPVPVLLLALLAGCSHLHVPHPNLHAARLWPFHHKAAPPPAAVDELVAEAAEGVSPVAMGQYWDRNTLLVDLTSASGEGRVRLRPAAGTTWPVRLEFRVQSGSMGRLEVEGAQRVSYIVPATGGQVVLKLDPGVYTTRTATLTVAWHPAELAGG
ncbi:MAG: hypothetical protein U1F06_09285 [Steroidobacteraceae bacterium]